MMRNLGIILRRTNPAKTVYSILDRQEGVICCSVAREDLCIGSCIEYTVGKQRSWLIADNVELIGLPFIGVSIDLWLFHKALEICSVCMPPGSSTPGVFEHMRYLYDDSIVPMLRRGVAKKIFLCKLLALLGFYPREKKFQKEFFHNLVTQPLDCIGALSVSREQEKEIEEWLQSCMVLHTQEQKFKTRSIGEWVEII